MSTTEVVLRRRRPHGRLPALLLVLSMMLLAGVAPPARADIEPPSPPVIEEPIRSAPAPPEVTAGAWVLMDATSGQVLAGQADQQRRPVASTIKILTALSVIERADLDDEVTVGEEVEVGGASAGLQPGDTWTIEELLHGLITRSGNDAAEALTAHVAEDREGFVEVMRADAGAIGLEELILTEASGLEDGNELTAHELATLSRVALADERLRPLFDNEQVDLPGQPEVDNRNELVGVYPGATGLKTGYTAAAGWSLVASAQRNGRELIAVVLDADEDPARFGDAIALLDHGFGEFADIALEVDHTLLVAGGQRSIRLGPASVVVPSGAEVELVGLPPLSAIDDPTIAVPLQLDDSVVAELTARQASSPAPTTPVGELGRTLVDQVHTGLRHTLAPPTWTS